MLPKRKESIPFDEIPQIKKAKNLVGLYFKHVDSDKVPTRLFPIYKFHEYFISEEGEYYMSVVWRDGKVNYKLSDVSKYLSNMTWILVKGDRS